MKHNIKHIANILVPIILLALAIFLIPRVIRFFFPFILGWLIYRIAEPLIRILDEKTKLFQRKQTSVFVVIFLISAIGFIMYFLFSGLVKIFVFSVSRLPDIYKSLMDTLYQFIYSNKFLMTHLPAEADAVIESGFNGMGEDISRIVTKFASPTVSFSLEALSKLPVLLIYTVVTIFSAYCFIKNGKKYSENIKSIVPEKFNKYFVYFKNDIKKIIHGWLRAQFKIMFCVFLILFIGFLVLGVKHSVLIAVFTAILDFLPLFGVGSVLWPWMILELVNGNFLRALGLLIIYLLAQILRQFMQPKIMGDTMGLSPFLTIFSMFIGFKFYGLTGFIFAVPVAMIIVSFYRYGAFDKMIDSSKELYDQIISFL